MRTRKQLLVNADPNLNPDATGAYHSKPVDCVAILEEIALRCAKIHPVLQSAKESTLDMEPA